MEELEALLDDLEKHLDGIESLPAEDRDRVFRLLDGIDVLHRLALLRLGDALGPDTVTELRSDPLIHWLLDAYGVGIDERAAAQNALDGISEELGSTSVEVLDARGGVVRVRLSGPPSCGDAAARTRVEARLRDRWPGFGSLEIVGDGSGAGPLQLRRRRRADAGASETPEALVGAVCSGTASDDAVEAWVNALLEVPTASMERAIRQSLEEVRGRPPADRERFRKKMRTASLTLHAPQLLRLEEAFARIAADVGLPDWS